MHSKTTNENMLNSCFRFRCAIVQAGSVVIFAHVLPFSALLLLAFLPGLLFFFWQTPRRASPALLPSCHHMCGSFWGFSRLAVSEIILPASFYYILVFNLNAACMSMSTRQVCPSCQLLVYRSTFAKLCNNCHLRLPCDNVRCGRLCNCSDVSMWFACSTRDVRVFLTRNFLHFSTE